MARPDITSWAGQLFKRQLNAALDWLEANGGGGGGGSGSGSFTLDDGTATTSGAFLLDEGGA